jgi:hypothetical protein
MLSMRRPAASISCASHSPDVRLLEGRGLEDRDHAARDGVALSGDHLHFR